MKWKVLESNYISKHRYFTARVDKCETPDGHLVPQYFVVELPPSACAVAITREGEVLMVRQYRHPVGDELLELPGGFVDAGEDPAEAMRRELMEETGYQFENVECVGKIAANPGVLNNYTYLFLATGGVPAGEQSLDPHEFLRIEKIALADLRKMFVQNEIMQSLHANCIYYALQKLDEAVVK